jgi:hypothetical protein
MPTYRANLAILATPSDPEHAARLQDVYDLVGAKMKDPVIAAATENLIVNYDSSDKTLTLKSDQTKAPIVLDGENLAVNDRVLIPNQTDKTQNGIYTVTTVGTSSVAWVLTRATDFDETSDIFTGVKVHVIKGDSYADTTFVLTTDDPQLDITNLVFVLDTGKIVNVKEKVFNITADASTTTWTFSHGYNTYNVTVDIIEQSTYYPTVYAEITRPSVNSVTITFSTPIGDSGPDYSVIVRAEV